jgi:hypothetical protein
MLNKIGFVWVLNSWDKMYRLLCAYKEQQNTTNIPNRYDQDPALGNWVNTQRTIYKKGELLQQREEMLNKIGFVWVLNSSDKLNSWDKMYRLLCAYEEQHDSTKVTREYDQDRALGKWVQTQRTIYKKGELLQQREELLNKIGFV